MKIFKIMFFYKKINIYCIFYKNRVIETEPAESIPSRNPSLIFKTLIETFYDSLR